MLKASYTYKYVQSSIKLFSGRLITTLSVKVTVEAVGRTLAQPRAEAIQD